MEKNYEYFFNMSLSVKKSGFISNVSDYLRFHPERRNGIAHYAALL